MSSKTLSLFILILSAFVLAACGDEGAESVEDVIEEGKSDLGEALEKGKAGMGDALEKGKAGMGDALEKGKAGMGDALEKGKAGMSDLVNAAKAKWDDLDIPDGVPGIPDMPKLTGDKAMDSAAITKALESLKAAWDANKDKLAALSKKGITGLTDEVASIRRNNEIYQKVANALQDMLDKVQGN